MGNITYDIHIFFSTGTYRAENAMCYQTGLRLDKFSIASTRYQSCVLLIIRAYYYYINYNCYY